MLNHQSPANVIAKLSHYSPGQALRDLGVSISQISRQSAHEGAKVVILIHRPPLPQEIFLVLISDRSWIDCSVIVRQEGLCQWNIPMTPSGVEPATFRLLAQCLNQLRHRIRKCSKMKLNSFDWQLYNSPPSCEVVKNEWSPTSTSFTPSRRTGTIFLHITYTRGRSS
jgi:hypothetical protein